MYTRNKISLFNSQEVALPLHTSSIEEVFKMLKVDNYFLFLVTMKEDFMA